ARLGDPAVRAGSRGRGPPGVGRARGRRTGDPRGGRRRRPRAGPHAMAAGADRHPHGRRIGSRQHGTDRQQRRLRGSPRGRPHRGPGNAAGHRCDAGFRCRCIWPSVDWPDVELRRLGEPMRIYEGSPRQDWEEVLRSVGAYLDDRGMRSVIFLETDNGFIVQGTSVTGNTGGAGDSMGTATRETLTLHDDDVSKFMDEAIARRGNGAEPSPKHYESQLRVIGRYLDEQHPRDIFFFELDGAYIAKI